MGEIIIGASGLPISVEADGTCSYCGLGFGDIFDHISCIDKAQEALDWSKKFQADPTQRTAVST